MAAQPVKGRKPKHQKQLGTSATGAYDCGPRSWQMGIDVQTGGALRPGPKRLRQLGGVAGPRTTRAEHAHQAIDALPTPKGFRRKLKYRMKLKRPWAEAERALRERKAVHIALDYGDINRNWPELSSQKTFHGGHSVLIFGIRRKKAPGAKGWEVGVNDPLASRRRWWPMAAVRHSAGKIAGMPRRFYGGVFEPGVRKIQDVEPPGPVDDPEETPVVGGPTTPETGEEVTDPSRQFCVDADDDIADDDSELEGQLDDVDPS